MAADVAMNDWDIDFDMDDPEQVKLKAVVEAMDKRYEESKAMLNAPVDTESMNGVEEAAEEGEVLADAPAPTKVHVRGLDNLNTFDVEDWAKEHFPQELLSKVQWIDDTSANIVYDTEGIASEALAAFSAENVVNPLQLRIAKSFSRHPNLQLQVRQAINNDVKLPEAKDRSRFYLMNKDWDPDNPDNVRPDNRRRRWRDEDRRDGNYRRRDYGRRREADDEPHYHESMYDDPPQPVEEVRRGSYSSGSEYGRRRVTFNRDLRVNNRQTGRLRDRSASPVRDGDGRFGFDEVHPRRRTPPPRSRTPPGVRPGRDNRDARDGFRKELFPDKRTTHELSEPRFNDSSRRPQYDRPASPNPSRELFPEKVNGSAHRRQKAKALTPNEVADAIGRHPVNAATNGGGRDLFSRISGGPKVESSFGRLRDDSSLHENGDQGFSIKGAGSMQQGDDFTFLGASRGRDVHPKVKELFPLKASSNGGGRDLFEDRMRARGPPRKRAEDLF